MNSPNYISPHFQKVHYPSSSNRDFRAAEGLNGGQVGDPVKLVNVTKTEYQYKYNGKEWQDELGLSWYDYGARNYDPALGRWMNYDPLAEVSRGFSPYTYALDNPVYFIDPDGMAAEDNATSQKNEVSSGIAGISFDLNNKVGAIGYSNYDTLNNGNNNTKNGDPRRIFLSSTTTTDIKIEFTPENHSTDGPEIITMQIQENSRYLQIGEDGERSLIYAQTVSTHTAVVNIDGDISRISVKTTYTEQNSKAENLMVSSHFGSYNYNDKITNSGSLNIFKSNILAVSEHRQSTNMSGAQDFHNRINNGIIKAGTSSTALGYFSFGSTPSKVLGGASTVAGIGWNRIKPKDIVFNPYYQMKRTP